MAPICQGEGEGKSGGGGGGGGQTLFPHKRRKKARKLPLDDKGGRKGKKGRNGCSRFWFGPSRLLYPPFRFPPLRGPRASHTSSSRDYSYARWGSAPYSLTRGQTKPRPLKEGGRGRGGDPFMDSFLFSFVFFWLLSCRGSTLCGRGREEGRKEGGGREG